MWLFPIIICFLPLLFLRCLNEIRRYIKTKNSIAFFHLFCTAGGGGERVLWSAVRVLQMKFPTYSIVIYTGDADLRPEEIELHARDKFNISLVGHVEFVYMKSRKLLDAKLYPHFTLLGQSIGAFLCGCEALWRYLPDVFVDSLGCAPTLPLFRIFGGCSTVAYVHYPTISTDMLTLVQSGESTYNNQERITRSRTLTRAKLLYYRVFAFLYGLMGKTCQMSLVNSTWTRNHIQQLWRPTAGALRIVYPPCQIDTFCNVSNKSEALLRNSLLRILSIAQFRPEKNHRLQLNIFASILKKVSDKSLKINCKLVFAGSCRNEEDQHRVQELQRYADSLDIRQHVEWKINISFEELLEESSQALIGLHTMWNEHFGIGIVEGMAAGNIMIAHNSGGPQSDIVVPAWPVSGCVGFLACSAEEYADSVLTVLCQSAEWRNEMRRLARERVGMFSEPIFAKTFIDAFSCVI